MRRGEGSRVVDEAIGTGSTRRNASASYHIIQ
jgi:hypothetical protein